MAAALEEASGAALEADAGEVAEGGVEEAVEGDPGEGAEAVAAAVASKIWTEIHRKQYYYDVSNLFDGKARVTSA